MEFFGVFTTFLVAALPLAVAVTKAVDTVRNAVDQAGRAPKVTWNLLAFILGIAICWGWGFNLFAPLVAAVPALKDTGIGEGTAGEILTGIAVGGLAGFYHERLDEWSSRAKAEQPVTSVK